MRLSERGTSELALNVLGMSLCDLLLNRCTELALPKPVDKDFPILAFADTKLGRLPRPPWLVWCRKPPFMVSPLLKHCKSSTGVSVEIPYLAVSEYFPEVRDVGFDKVPGVG